MSMADRTILVTGASSGIGRETATLLSELDARVILTGRDRSRLESTLERLSGSGHRIEPFELAEAEAIPNWLRKLTAETGPLHGMVHCAGIQQTIPLRAVTVAKSEALMRLNLMSAIMLVKGFRQKGCCAAPASVVLMSSITGLTGQPGVSVYSASKSALIGFGRASAMELAGEGIRVNCVAPGYVQTEMTEGALSQEQFEAIARMHPMGIGQPRDVANAVAFLLADTGRWITGTTLVVDGGYTAR
jgi:NAD(P)-dependent dehydrogenase (short-subunit alcohol dehydrogenase family)